MTRPERIARLRERLIEVERNLASFRGTFPATNSPEHQDFFFPILKRIDFILENEKTGVTLELATDLQQARNHLRRLPLPDIDPELGAATPSLRALRGERGNLAEALENAFEAAQDAGLEPRFSEFESLPVPHSRFAAQLIRLDERLRTVQDQVLALREEAAAADAAGAGPVSQTALVNPALRTLTVEVDAARFETHTNVGGVGAAVSDLASLTRSVEAIRDSASSLKQMAEGLRALVVPSVAAIGRAVAQAGERSWQGVRAVVRLVRWRGDGTLNKAVRQRPQANTDLKQTSSSAMHGGLPAAQTASLPKENNADDVKHAIIATLRLEVQKYTRLLQPMAWARANYRLGAALHDIGRETAQATLVEEAISVLRETLLVYTRHGPSFRWAATQNQLGNALATLGAFESGTAHLEAAVDAYRDALLLYTRESTPLEWAMTQNNLGNALQNLGARESGTAQLEAAVAAYREALLERTRDRVPLDWAMTQNNLGTALQTMGVRESGTARLKAAVTAFREALLEFTRDRFPLDWAMTQNNLGNALRTLGARESGTAQLEAAVAAYREALLEYTRDRVPLDWAMTQNNLGTALASLGAHEDGTARLEAAVTAYCEALLEYTRDRAPFLWAQTMENLALARGSLAERRGDPALLRRALGDCEAALAEYQQAGAEFYITKATRLLHLLHAKLPGH
jgi:tetratricopeptide (TPR) repeat protein